MLEVAQRLGYEPNAVALALRSGRTEIVLVEFPDWPLGPPVVEAIDTMIEALEELGYTPLVHFQRADPRSLARASQRVHPVGVIAPAPELSAEVASRLRMLGARGLIAFGARPLPHVYTYVIDQAAPNTPGPCSRTIRSQLVTVPTSERRQEATGDRGAGGTPAP